MRYPVSVAVQQSLLPGGIKHYVFTVTGADGVTTAIQYTGNEPVQTILRDLNRQLAAHASTIDLDDGSSFTLGESGVLVPNDVTAPILLRKSVTLTDAQIKVLPTIPFEIAPSPGVGLTFQSVLIVYQSRIVTPYTNISADLKLCDDTGSGLLLNDTTDGGNYSSGILTYSQTAVGGIGYAINALAAGGYVEFVDLSNISLKLYALNSAGNFTGGDPANLLKVTAYYIIVPTL